VTTVPHAGDVWSGVSQQEVLHPSVAPAATRVRLPRLSYHPPTCRALPPCPQHAAQDEVQFWRLLPATLAALLGATTPDQSKNRYLRRVRLAFIQPNMPTTHGCRARFVSSTLWPAVSMTHLRYRGGVGFCGTMPPSRRRPASASPGTSRWRAPGS